MLRSFGLVDQFRTLAAFVCAATLASTPAIAQDGVPALAITAPPSRRWPTPNARS